MAEKKRGLFGWIACGCLVLLLGCAGIGTAGFFTVTGILKRTTPYQEAMRRANASDEAKDLLGSPIEAGWLPSGSVNESGGGGTADLSIPVHGPKQKGTIYVKAHRDRGHWQFDQMELDPESGGPVDLLNEEGDGGGQDSGNEPGIENL